MDGGARKNPRTVEEVFGDFKARRNGLIKALTTDVKDLYNLCDPERENLCLYGLRNEEWKVNLPGTEAPPVIPEPTLGINFARDGISEKDWLALVSVHSDAWLVSVAFHIAARFSFDKADRKRLFKMMNDLPLISEVLFGGAKKQTKKKSSVTNPKPKSNSKPGKLTKTTHKAKDEEEGFDEDKVGESSHGETLCVVCNKDYPSDVFWICCDMCKRWFHGKCVRITPTKAKTIENYKCPYCSCRSSCS